MSLKRLATAYMNGSLVWQIVIGLILGIALAAVWPQGAKSVGLLGDFFVGALKAVAPVLVLVLVASAIAQHKTGNQVYIKPILLLYLLGTFAAALVAVLVGFVFATSLARV